jgi:NAD-dependent SIR2 family protein deacetylase
LEGSDVTTASSERTHVAGSLVPLAERLAAGNVVVLTGAGVSTGSGIPDYRDERGEWKRAQPVQYRDFVGSVETRRRYWGRSVLGWPHFRASLPNAGHGALAELERRGLLSLLVTQNVDGLHQAAGSQNVVDLHGRLDRVVCLACKADISRDSHQARLVDANPTWLERKASVAPDGDADLEASDYSSFRVVDCEACGGVLKPDVVFFGETVPAARVETAMNALAAAQALLVVGSSLMVYSGFRFARRAQALSIPVLLLNRGRTRADEFAAHKVDAEVGATLSELAGALR